MAFDTILFDLDGTLTDSGPGIMNGVEYAVREMGLAPHPKEFYRRFIGPPLQWSFRHYCGLDEAGARRAVETYRVYYSDKGIWENAPYPGIPDLLAALQAAGAALMVATSKPEVMAVQVLERFGLMPFLTCVGRGLPGRGRRPEGRRGPPLPGTGAGDSGDGGGTGPMTSKAPTPITSPPSACSTATGAGRNLRTPARNASRKAYRICSRSCCTGR